ncbi:MAG: response regulator [Lachnospiraceae bacterium]|nr:response regulator [Lachnospiraceae bacterium]
MDKSIVLLSEKNTLLVNVLSEGLEKGGFHVENVKTNVSDISLLRSYSRIWLMYLPGEETEVRDAYELIKREIESRGDILFFLVGNPNEIKFETEFFSQQNIAESFARPFRVEDIVEVLDAYATNRKRVHETKHVLLVDDDATALQTIKSMLSDNYNVYTANTAFNAIRILDKAKMDLILLDYEMPVIKGPQVLELFRNDPVTKDIPVMFLTSKNDKEAISTALSVKPDNYLLKSLPQSEILKVLDTFFEGK